MTAIPVYSACIPRYCLRHVHVGQARGMKSVANHDEGAPRTAVKTELDGLAKASGIEGDGTSGPDRECLGPEIQIESDVDQPRAVACAVTLGQP